MELELLMAIKLHSSPVDTAKMDFLEVLNLTKLYNKFKKEVRGEPDDMF